MQGQPGAGTETAGSHTHAHAAAQRGDGDAAANQRRACGGCGAGVDGSQWSRVYNMQRARRLWRALHRVVCAVVWGLILRAVGSVYILQ